MKCMAKSGLQKLTPVIFLVTIACCQLYGQNRTVTGKVTNMTGEAVTGATISVVGSTMGTSAGTDGGFSIAAPPNGTLRVSAVGYEGLDIKIANQTTLTVQL